MYRKYQVYLIFRFYNKFCTINYYDSDVSAKYEDKRIILFQIGRGK